MKSTDVERHLENVDRRLDRIEQILPTLATKADLAILETQVGLLATKVTVLYEGTRHEISVIAEGVTSLTERLERKGVI